MAQERLTTPQQPPVRGRLTYVDLSRTQAFFRPWEQDPWGKLRPPFSQELMRLSLELSATAYNLRVADWMRAGWTDFNFQVDNKLMGGVAQAQITETKQFLYNKWALYRARSSARQINPVSQVLSAMRQREQSDTGKVVIMIREAAEGRYVVALGFRGTGSRFYDWFSNFRFVSENGIHQGFLQLARQLDQNAERIAFPETAKALGLERLTLADILHEARQHDSRFRLWLCGHSQGAAIMQILTHFWIRESGVLPENLLGYGFASPMVAMGTAIHDPSSYPLYNVLNSDDYVTRYGAQMHLGVCLTYPAGDALRRAAYGWRETDAAQASRAAIRRLTRNMVDMPTMIEYGVAYMQMLATMPMQEMLAAMHLVHLRILPIRQVMAVTGTSQQSLLLYMRRRVEKAYLSITGHSLSQARLDSLQLEMQDIVQTIGAAEFSRALGELYYWPHVLNASSGKAYSAYHYISLKGVDMLHPAVWQSGVTPRLVWLEPALEEAQSAAGRELLLPGGLNNRRRFTPPRRQAPALRPGYARHRAAARR